MKKPESDRLEIEVHTLESELKQKKTHHDALKQEIEKLEREETQKKTEFGKLGLEQNDRKKHTEEGHRDIQKKEAALRELQIKLQELRTANEHEENEIRDLKNERLK